ncbi:hypothetical protein JXM83_05330 [Candidatus Woesearchaeota archaeon]|nr:hypothetical protein [Candidatus Woesearchaeota archaeon]
MEGKYVKATYGDKVYDAILWKTIDDHYDNPFLGYNELLREKLKELEEGKMPVDVYSNFLEKGVVKILQEMKQKDDNSKLLRKIERENPELLK